MCRLAAWANANTMVVVVLLIVGCDSSTQNTSITKPMPSAQNHQQGNDRSDIQQTPVPMRTQQATDFTNETARKHLAGEQVDEATMSTLRSYVIGTTSYQQFRKDFGLGGLRGAPSRILNPTSVPGKIKIIYMSSKSSSSGSLQDVLSGKDADATVLFGYLNSGSGATSYLRAPDRFEVVCTLEFQKGVLSTISFDK